MKSKIVPLLFFSLILPCIASRAFQHKNRTAVSRETHEERVCPEYPCFSNAKTADLLINYAELSTKQINFLIP